MKLPAPENYTDAFNALLTYDLTVPMAIVPSCCSNHLATSNQHYNSIPVNFT